jgi:hypothetical protein
MTEQETHGDGRSWTLVWGQSRGESPSVNWTDRRRARKGMGWLVDMYKCVFIRIGKAGRIRVHGCGEKIAWLSNHERQCHNDALVVLLWAPSQGPG